MCADHSGEPDLADGLFHVAYLLDFSDTQAAAVLGPSEIFVTDPRAGTRIPKFFESRTGVRAAKLVAVYEALSHQLDRWSDVRLWFEGHNIALGDRPHRLVQSPQGLEAVVRHVGAR